ncbi:MAG: hypothetical protein JST54_32050 [Deltaproteobacteria bacterium]|nr:hypothetical protein [Deltaproteobacteria bacterium]
MRWLLVLALAASGCARSEALQPRVPLGVDAGVPDAGAFDAGQLPDSDAGCVEVAAYDAGHACDVANPCGLHQACDPVLLPCHCRSGHSLEIGTTCVDVSDVVGPSACQTDGDCGFHWYCDAGVCAESPCDESGCEPGCYSTSMTHVTCSPCICGSCAFEGD